MSRMRAVRAIVAATLVAGALFVVPPAAAAPESILGVWSFRDGSIEVEKVDTNRYVGRVKETIHGTDCNHFRGERFWTMRETDPNFYVGTQFGHRNDCDVIVEFDATWGVSGTLLTLCLTDPKTDESFCQDLQRSRYTIRIFEWDMRVKGQPTNVQSDDPSYSTTTFADYGRVVQEWSPEGWQLLKVTGGTFTIVDHYVPPAPDKKTVVKIVGDSALVDFAGPRRSLGVELIVESSDYEVCQPDSRGTLVLLEPRGDRSDEVSVGFCGVEVKFVHGARRTDVVKVVFQRKE